MRHTRKDRTFVYYYSVSAMTGETHGVRFSRGTVTSFRGHDPNPEKLPVGRIWNLPVGPDDATGELYDAIAEVIEIHPEVADLLTGREILA